jgi:hypothetical protein
VLSQKSSHNENLKNANSLEQYSKHSGAEDLMVKEQVPGQSSLGAKACVTHATETSKHVLIRKSSHNEKLIRSSKKLEIDCIGEVGDEPMVRHVDSRTASLGAKHSESTPAEDKHPSQALIDEKSNHHRLRRNNDIVRKPPDRHQSNDNILSQASTEKLADFRQQQRMKTLNGIFGCNWKTDSSGSIQAHPVDLVRRPATRRSKSDDLKNLRKALQDVYSGPPKK